jgi:hypothetical protein
MDIHQMQVRYEPAADRLLWQVRTFGGELFEVWLTRRLFRLFWPPLQQRVVQSGILQVLPQADTATVMPEAREMLAQQARERPLPAADFSVPFNPQAQARPLGEQPLLPSAVDLGKGAQGHGLALRLREAGGRQLELNLTADLATALTRLFEQVLAAADWNLEPPPSPPAAGEPPALRHTLN